MTGIPPSNPIRYWQTARRYVPAHLWESVPATSERSISERVKPSISIFGSKLGLLSGLELDHLLHHYHSSGNIESDAKDNSWATGAGVDKGFAPTIGNRDLVEADTGAHYQKNDGVICFNILLRFRHLSL